MFEGSWARHQVSKMTRLVCTPSQRAGGGSDEATGGKGAFAMSCKAHSEKSEARSISETLTSAM
jgi:hypothetical protein